MKKTIWVLFSSYVGGTGKSFRVENGQLHITCKGFSYTWRWQRSKKPFWYLQKNDAVSCAQLRALLLLLCTSSSRVMSSHFTLFMAHTLRALSHLKLSVRVFATSVLTVLMNSYPELCINCGDLFDAFLTLFAGNRKPSNKQVYFFLCFGFIAIWFESVSSGRRFFWIEDRILFVLV